MTYARSSCIIEFSKVTFPTCNYVRPRLAGCSAARYPHARYPSRQKIVGNSCDLRQDTRPERSNLNKANATATATRNPEIEAAIVASDSARRLRKNNAV